MARGFVQGREWGVTMKTKRVCKTISPGPKATRIIDFLFKELNLQEGLVKSFTLELPTCGPIMIRDMVCYVEEDDE